MLYVDEYRTMFAEKLLETMSLDAAFRKVIHRAYQHGFKEANNNLDSIMLPQEKMLEGQAEWWLEKERNLEWLKDSRINLAKESFSAGWETAWRLSI